MKTIKAALVTLFLTISGCTTTYITEAPTLNENLLVKCPETLSTLEGTTGKDFITLVKSWSAQYHDCRVRHNGLVETLEQRESTEVVKWWWEN